MEKRVCVRERALLGDKEEKNRVSCDRKANVFAFMLAVKHRAHASGASVLDDAVALRDKRHVVTYRPLR